MFRLVMVDDTKKRKRAVVAREEGGVCSPSAGLAKGLPRSKTTNTTLPVPTQNQSRIYQKTQYTNCIQFWNSIQFQLELHTISVRTLYSFS